VEVWRGLRHRWRTHAASTLPGFCPLLPL